MLRVKIEDSSTALSSSEGGAGRGGGAGCWDSPCSQLLGLRGTTCPMYPGACCQVLVPGMGSVFLAGLAAPKQEGPWYWGCRGCWCLSKAEFREILMVERPAASDWQSLLVE